MKLNNLANSYRYSGEATKAVPLYVQALEIFKQKSGESPEFATATFNLGQAYLQIGDNRANEFLLQALALRGKLFGKNHPAFREIKKKLTASAWLRKDYPATESYFKKTFDNYFAQVDAYFSALS
ncbi:MAG: tetratricopeptide repeat protein [Cytophagales bacterium]